MLGKEEEHGKFQHLKRSFISSSLAQRHRLRSSDRDGLTLVASSVMRSLKGPLDPVQSYTSNRATSDGAFSSFFEMEDLQPQLEES